VDCLLTKKKTDVIKLYSFAKKYFTMRIIDELSTEKEKEEFFAKAPKYLYKYRVWDDENHKKILT
jgi:hypothetical protein